MKTFWALVPKNGSTAMTLSYRRRKRMRRGALAEGVKVWGETDKLRERKKEAEGISERWEEGESCPVYTLQANLGSVPPASRATRNGALPTVVGDESDDDNDRRVSSCVDFEKKNIVG